MKKFLMILLFGISLPMLVAASNDYEDLTSLYGLFKVCDFTFYLFTFHRHIAEECRHIRRSCDL